MRFLFEYTVKIGRGYKCHSCAAHFWKLVHALLFLCSSLICSPFKWVICNIVTQGNAQESHRFWKCVCVKLGNAVRLILHPPGMCDLISGGSWRGATQLSFLPGRGARKEVGAGNDTKRSYPPFPPQKTAIKTVVWGRKRMRATFILGWRSMVCLEFSIKRNLSVLSPCWNHVKHSVFSSLLRPDRWGSSTHQVGIINAYFLVSTKSIFTLRTVLTTC